MVSTIGTSEAPLIGFAGGGSGGHLFPALAVAEAMRCRLPHARFVLFGTDRSIDQQIISDAGFDLVKQPLLPVSTALWRWPSTLRSYRASMRLCRRSIHHDKPAVIVGTGGLGSVPPMRLALKKGIPTALLNPDLIPGRANRYLAKHAHVIFTQWEASSEHLPTSAKVRVTGCPVRAAFQSGKIADAHERFNLDPSKKTLLITGASQGARTINQAVVALLDEIEALTQWQVLHLAGQLDFESVASAYDGRTLRACVLPFTHQMSAAMSVATLVVSRAGASTLAELAAMGCPSILLPYPFHKDMHQLANARMMAQHGAAVVLDDMKQPSLNAPVLRDVLMPLLGVQKRLAVMASAAQSVGRPDAASMVADEILSLVCDQRTKVMSESTEPDYCTGRS